MNKRQENEIKFGNWSETDFGGRRYWYEVKGKAGYYARYVKEVDQNEVTLKFYQEIYNFDEKLIEIHEKFPFDKGHRKL